MNRVKKSLTSAFLFFLCFLITGCAAYRPKLDPNAAYFQRLKTQTQGGVTVSVVGLGAHETKQTLGVNLSYQHILPLWIKIENKDTEYAYSFFERNVDPNYFTAAEAAYMSRLQIGNVIKKFLPPVLHFIVLPLAPIEHVFMGHANDKLEETFEEHAFQHGWIKPSESREGFMFVPYELGLKELSLNLEGYVIGTDLKESEKITRRFDFIIEIPGIRQDYLGKDLESYYPSEKYQHFEKEADLVRYVENLSCCVTNKKGTKNGDPINLVVIGSSEDILTSFTVAKWDETEALYWRSIMKTMGSVFMKKNYRYSPVSPLYFFGRSQDIAFQKARKTIDQRMHMRLWYAPATYQGKNIWIGTVSRDIGVRFTRKTWNLTTHKIDPDINEAVFYTLNDLIDAKQVEVYGITSGIPPSTKEKPALNLTGDPYFTKGTRAILLLSKIRFEGVPERMESSAAKAAADKLRAGLSSSKPAA